MPTDEEQLEAREQALNEERARAAALKARIDALDAEVNPAKPAIDHANDGGVV